MGDPVDVLARVQAHVRGHAREKDVRAGVQLGHGDSLPLQIADSADPVGPEQLVAPDCTPPSITMGSPGVDPDDERGAIPSRCPLPPDARRSM